MIKFTQRQLKELVRTGAAIDITNAAGRDAIPDENYVYVGYAAGANGRNGLLLKGNTSGKLYAITARTMAIFIF